MGESSRQVPGQWLSSDHFMWTALRKEIEKIRRQLQIADGDFAPLPVTTDWNRLEENIYRAFCRIDHPTARPVWLWERLKVDKYSIGAPDGPCTMLDKLVDAHERVWLMVNESTERGDVFWFYEGRIRAIQQVINESCHLDEFYIVSRKYEWLLCLNHHDVLIAAGDVMAKRLRAYRNH